MGIDIDGGIIVGTEFENITTIPAEYEGENYEWVEDNGFSKFSPWYDAGIDHYVIGYTVESDVIIEDLDSWLKDVREKAAKFEAITGVPARLIGMQDVW